MNPSRVDNWIRIGRMYTFSCRRLFAEIRAPNTSILVPLLFVTVTSALVAWIVVPVILTETGIGEQTLLGTPHPFSEFEFSDFTEHLLLEVPYAIFQHCVDLILLGTYFFVVARCYRITDIHWEHWFGFACWTLVPMISVDGAVSFIDIYAGTVDPSLWLSITVVVLCFLLPIVWTASLTVLGLRTWTSQGWFYNLAFGAVPYALYGLVYAQDILKLFVRAAFQFP